MWKPEGQERPSGGCFGRPFDKLRDREGLITAAFLWIGGRRLSGAGLFEDPVLEGCDLLDVDLLLGILLFGREVNLLLDTIGGQGALVLERTRAVFLYGQTRHNKACQAYYGRLVVDINAESLGDEFHDPGRQHPVLGF